eukprot:gene3544-7054_t
MRSLTIILFIFNIGLGKSLLHLGFKRSSGITCRGNLQVGFTSGETPNAIEQFKFSENLSVDLEEVVTSDSVVPIVDLKVGQDVLDVKRVLQFLIRAGIIGTITGLSVGVFKSSIFATSQLLFETLADFLPKPVFYWPLMIYPILGSIGVALITYYRGPSIANGIDSIAKSIDAPTIKPLNIIPKTNINEQQSSTDLILQLQSTTPPSKTGFDPMNQIVRLMASVCTLGSGCSLGPEGPSVELGASISRIFCGSNATSRERHHLFLAGTAAGVSAGFGAPIAGVFFAIECGNRYLKKNTVKLDEESPDGPREDIAAIVLAATLANIFLPIGMRSDIKLETLSIMGNSYAMVSPLFELPSYLGLGLVCGFISVCFNKLRDLFVALYKDAPDGTPSSPLARIPLHLRPILGGVVCGVTSVFYPQTLFAGYGVLENLLADNYHFALPLLSQLLVLKLLLSSFSLASGLVGGVFAPSIFFGAAAGTAYYQLLIQYVSVVEHVTTSIGGPDLARTVLSFFTIANGPAYATVGAAATLGALFRAPLTASMLMFEITQNHDIVLPVLATAGLAGLFAEVLIHPRLQW